MSFPPDLQARTRASPPAGVGGAGPGWTAVRGQSACAVLQPSPSPVFRAPRDVRSPGSPLATSLSAFSWMGLGCRRRGLCGLGLLSGGLRGPWHSPADQVAETSEASCLPVQEARSLRSRCGRGRLLLRPLSCVWRRHLSPCPHIAVPLCVSVSPSPRLIRAPVIWGQSPP